MINSLQAALNAQAATDQEEAPKPKKKACRSEKVLIGGHFGKEWSRQLAIIAAEEDTTKQALLEEALNLLFVKKGKDALGV